MPNPTQDTTGSRSVRRALPRPSWLEISHINEVLRKETVGGMLLVAATAIALLWANLSPTTYGALRDFHVGPAALHLNLSLGHWAADGLLAIFFFLAGLELKHEFVAGSLKSPAKAALPVAAAVGGMIVPALLFTAFNLGDGQGALAGWAIPTATDIAFALAVLAVVGTQLPAGLRTFLLTLAVVDDLLAIIVIAVFYSSDLQPLFLAAAAIPLALFAVLVRRRITHWWLLFPLAFATWMSMHASGIHATVAGVLLGFTVPVLREGVSGVRDIAHEFEHLWRPISAGFAVPVFAFFAAGVTIGGAEALGAALTDTVALGIVVGLVVGKSVGILSTTWLMARFTRATLDPALSWIDVLGVSVLGGIGFTVSLLIGDLAFGDSGGRGEVVKIAVLLGSLSAAGLASVILVLRNRVYRRINEADAVDADHDGVPDVYEQDEEDSGSGTADRFV
ncbi:Na+/H+ antiporter NhaA [Schaalia sp. 19OD2882]|uniref:Na+/H+ antiporter NhaA n=1 Tax=Schaalia sp. 19OD2882 TaxID=2794089 RepID=UPI001C1ECD34|nr:Na+/H+ antiporter NhaA [Schaalia sp. 19OD2882]QWW20223.1 Na+/H+ antiporter NhaA [Schaalia sp. 19OD2882]